jgi:hypothetical protein
MYCPSNINLIYLELVGECGKGGISINMANCTTNHVVYIGEEI